MSTLNLNIDTVKSYIKKGKDAVLNTPEIERKVRDATSNDKWGPSGTQMLEIARASYNYECFPIIMGVIWKRINDPGKYWRHVYKSLLLIDYLVRSGSPQVIRDCRHHTMEIKTLTEFQYIEDEKDVGVSVRERAKLVIELLHDDQRIKEERDRAKSNQNKYVGIGNDSRDFGYGGGSGSVGYGGNGSGGYDPDPRYSNDQYGGSGGGRDTYGRDTYGRDTYGRDSNYNSAGGNNNRDYESYDSPSDNYNNSSNSRSNRNNQDFDDNVYNNNSNNNMTGSNRGSNSNNNTINNNVYPPNTQSTPSPNTISSGGRRPRAASGGNLAVPSIIKNEPQLIDFNDSPQPKQPNQVVFDPLDSSFNNNNNNSGIQQQRGGGNNGFTNFGNGNIGQQQQQQQSSSFQFNQPPQQQSLLLQGGIGGGNQQQQHSSFQFNQQQPQQQQQYGNFQHNRQNDSFGNDDVFGDFSSSNNHLANNNINNNNSNNNSSDFNPFDQPSNDFNNKPKDLWNNKELFDLGNLGKNSQQSPVTNNAANVTKSSPARVVNGPITSAGSTIRPMNNNMPGGMGMNNQINQPIGGGMGMGMGMRQQMNQPIGMGMGIGMNNQMNQMNQINQMNQMNQMNQSGGVGNIGMGMGMNQQSGMGINNSNRW